MPINRVGQMKHLRYFIRKLSSPDGALRINTDRTWCNKVPDAPGVYTIFSKGKIVYCGETTNLRARMKDLCRTVNHTFRRNFGNDRFSSHAQFTRATAKKRFSKGIESLLNREMCRLDVKAIPISIGRKEIEEIVIHDLCPKYNDSRKRRR
jgi:predicted GIY-YIG superfamily endonuclease